MTTPAPLAERIGEVLALAPIERDEAMDRSYIPLPGGWEVQTKGKGSTFRLCDTKSHERFPLVDASSFSPLADFIERMAHEVREEHEKAIDLLRECAEEIEKLEKSRRALRNRLISEMQSKIDGPYELRIASAEAKVNEFEEAFEKAMGWVND